MGKKSSKRAAREAEARNRQQAAENARIQAENARRINEAESRNRRLAVQQSLLQKKTEWETARTEAANKAKAAVYDERIKALKDSNKLMTDWEVQERRRLLRAKQGANQTKDEDYAITGEDRQRALDLLHKPEEYWSNKAQVAYDQAWQKYGDFKGETASASSGCCGGARAPSRAPSQAAPTQAAPTPTAFSPFSKPVKSGTPTGINRVLGLLGMEERMPGLSAPTPVNISTPYKPYQPYKQGMFGQGRQQTGKAPR